MAKKSWIEKRDCEKSFQVKTIEKKFADIPEGAKMLIASPPIIDTYVSCIPFGKIVAPATMRNDLAIEYQADKSCPVTTGIFLRIVAEAAYMEIMAGKSMDEVTPFWRIIDPTSKLASKLTCGADFISKQRAEEVGSI